MARLRVRNWDRDFECAQSRKTEVLRWFAMPNKVHGVGYSLLMAEPNALQLYGAWCCLLSALSRHRKRSGWLTTDGTPSAPPLTPQILALTSRAADVQTFQAMLDRVAQPDINWIERVDETSGKILAYSEVGSALPVDYQPATSSLPVDYQSATNHLASIGPTGQDITEQDKKKESARAGARKRVHKRDDPMNATNEPPSVPATDVPEPVGSEGEDQLRADFEELVALASGWVGRVYNKRGNPKRWEAYRKARKKLGLSRLAAIAAVYGNAHSEFHRAGDYHGWQLIFRDRDHADRFIRQARKSDFDESAYFRLEPRWEQFALGRPEWEPVAKLLQIYEEETGVRLAVAREAIGLDQLRAPLKVIRKRLRETVLSILDGDAPIRQQFFATPDEAIVVNLPSNGESGTVVAINEKNATTGILRSEGNGAA